MKRVTSFCLLFAFTFSISYAQSVSQVDFKMLSKEISPTADTVKVVNFWATWCKPCVEEMKYFQEAIAAYKHTKVKFIFVSLDFSSQKNKVEEFKAKRKIDGNFYLLSDDPNKWINKIDPTWAGDIPYTLVIGPKDKRSKINKSIARYEELDAVIKTHLKK